MNKIRNPFRTRWRVEAMYIGTLQVNFKHFVVEYRKWYQLKWNPIIIREGGLVYPKHFFTRHEAEAWINQFK